MKLLQKKNYDNRTHVTPYFKFAKVVNITNSHVILLILSYLQYFKKLDAMSFFKKYFCYLMQFSY